MNKKCEERVKKYDIASTPQRPYTLKSLNAGDTVSSVIPSATFRQSTVSHNNV